MPNLKCELGYATFPHPEVLCEECSCGKRVSITKMELQNPVPATFFLLWDLASNLEPSKSYTAAAFASFARNKNRSKINMDNKWGRMQGVLPSASWDGRGALTGAGAAAGTGARTGAGCGAVTASVATAEEAGTESSASSRTHHGSSIARC
jgi:hypothetical protein